MSGYTLKIIAMVTMLIDHLTAVFVPYDSWLYMIGRSVGRLSFPIFCFLITEGHRHTRDIKKYLFRLLIFAFISEIPFDMAFYYPFSDSNYMYHQNIYFTLFIGLLVITIIDYIEDYFAFKYRINSNSNNNIPFVIKNLLSMGVLLAGCLIAYLIKSDYSFVGVLMIWTFYIYKNDIKLLFISQLILNLIYGFPQVLGVFSLYFINRYNGERGKQANKYLIYGFYPLHLLIIFLIKFII